MESLVAGVKVTQKKRLRVVDVDADRNPALARELEVTEFPTLVRSRTVRSSTGWKGGQPGARSTS